MRIKKGSPIHELLKGKCIIENRDDGRESELAEYFNMVIGEGSLENAAILSHPVQEYMWSNFEKFVEIAKINMYEDSGITIYNKNLSIGYRSIKKDGKFYIATIAFSSNYIELFELTEIANDRYLPMVQYVPPSKEFFPNYCHGDASIRVMAFMMFKKYAEVEVKTIIDGPNKKTRVCGVKYMNETNVPVKIIDSHYFRTIIKSGAFKVSGHFRLQPCGPNRSERKLIWIKDFQKTGYTREAGVKKIRDLQS